ncbi:MAG: phasin family protein, partial [Paracoccaceae bacterium]
FKSSALLNQKLANIALEAASKSTEISTAWAKDTIGKLQAVSSAKEEPANYVAAMTEFASNQAELASENVTAFTEIAKKVQMETVEIIMAAGKEMTEETSSAVKKASKDVAAASKKVTTVK